MTCRHSRIGAQYMRLHQYCLWCVPDASYTIRTSCPLGLGCACKMYFLYLYNVGRFNVDFKCLFTLDYIARLFGHQWMHSTVLLCVQYNVKLCRLFFKLSKEANVAAITITSQLHDTITKTNGNAMAVSQFELFSVLHIQTDIFCTLTYE